MIEKEHMALTTGKSFRVERRKQGAKVSVRAYYDASAAEQTLRGFSGF